MIKVKALRVFGNRLNKSRPQDDNMALKKLFATNVK
jgi:hypothetical protein